LQDIFLNELLKYTECWSSNPSLQACRDFAGHLGISSAKHIELQNNKKVSLAEYVDLDQYLGCVHVDVTKLNVLIDKMVTVLSPYVSKTFSQSGVRKKKDKLMKTKYFGHMLSLGYGLHRYGAKVITYIVYLDDYFTLEGRK
jgi:hypothetical protein